MSQISKTDWLFCCSQSLQSIANNRIDAKRAIHCFQMWISAFCKLSVQIILQESILPTLCIKPSKQGTERICWYRCTADPMHRQCLKARAHKRCMLLKKNNVCMHNCKPGYLSINDHNLLAFSLKINILSTIRGSFRKSCKLHNIEVTNIKTKLLVVSNYKTFTWLNTFTNVVYFFKEKLLKALERGIPSMHCINKQVMHLRIPIIHIRAVNAIATWQWCPVNMVEIL